MTLATLKLATPPAVESAPPSGPRRQIGGRVTRWAPGFQAASAYRTTHAPATRRTEGSVSGSTSSVGSSLPARTCHPAGTVSARTNEMVSPTVGLAGDAAHPAPCAAVRRHGGTAARTPRQLAIKARRGHRAVVQRGLIV